MGDSFMCAIQGFLYGLHCILNRNLPPRKLSCPTTYQGPTQDTLRVLGAGEPVNLGDSFLWGISGINF